MPGRFGYRKIFSTPVLSCVLAVVVAATGVAGWAIAQDSGKISKFLMIKLSREASQVLCQSEEFTACMGFTEQACIALSEKALQQCIMPLPDTVYLRDLNSDVLEACPQQVYEEAGYSNEKAAACVQEASEN